MAAQQQQQYMELFWPPLNSSTGHHPHQRATHCLAAPQQHHDYNNGSADVVRAADDDDDDDFVNCSSFYANIYPSKINRKKVGCSSITRSTALSSLVGGTKRQSSLLLSSSLPDLPSASETGTHHHEHTKKQLSPTAAATTDEDGESLTKVMLSSLHRGAGEEQLSSGGDDALVDSSRLFECCGEKQRRNSSNSSNSSSYDDDNNNKDDDELCSSSGCGGNDEDSAVLPCGGDDGKRKTNSLLQCAADHTTTDILSPSQGELRVATAGHHECLNMKKKTCDGLQSEQRCCSAQERPDEPMMMTSQQRPMATQKRVCSISPPSPSPPAGERINFSENSLPPSGEENESAAQVIDVEKEEEMLRQASMVSKGLHHKNKEETPPPIIVQLDDVITIEDVSDEEFQNSKYYNNNNNADPEAIDLETEVVKDETKSSTKGKKIPKLDLEDPLLKGFEVALDKISLNKRSDDCLNGEAGDLTSDTDATTGDDPITRRAIERLERKLKEVLKPNMSSVIHQPPHVSNSWPAAAKSSQRFDGKEPNRPNGMQDGEVVQLRKQVVRTPIPSRLSARHSSCISPIAEVDPAAESAAEITNGAGSVNEAEFRNDDEGKTKSVNGTELRKVGAEPEKKVEPLRVVVSGKAAKMEPVNGVELRNVPNSGKDVQPIRVVVPGKAKMEPVDAVGKVVEAERGVEPLRVVEPVKVSEPLKVIEEAPNTEERTAGEKSSVTLEVNGHTTQPSLQSNRSPEISGNKGIYKATFITPILRRKASPPRSYLEAFKTKLANDDEPLDLRSNRTSHSERVFSVPSSPVWPSFSSRFSDSMTPMSPRLAQQAPISSFDYQYRPSCLPVDCSRVSPGMLRNDRLLPPPTGMGPDRLINTSPHQIFADNDWRFGNMDMNNFPQYCPSFEPLSTEPYGLDENLASLSSARVTSRRPLHAREQLRVYTDPVSPHRSHFRTESGDFKSGVAPVDQTPPFNSSFRNYAGQDAMDPIARKALERFDCCTTNSPRTFVSSTSPTALNSGYNAYQDPIVRSAVMRMDNQLAGAYTPVRRSDYPNSISSRRSSINYMDTCDAVPDGASQLLSMREDGTSSSMAALSPNPSSGTRSREGSAAPPSLVDHLENRSARGLRHIFNYLEDHDYKLSHSQSTLKQTPSRQYFSTSREYTRPKVRPGESISRQNDSERPSFSQEKPFDSINFDIRLRSPTPPKPVFTDKLPPKNPSDRQDNISNSMSDRHFIRGSSSFSNLYIPKDVHQEGKDSLSVDYDFNEITSSSEGQQPSSSARSTPAMTTSRQNKGRGVEVPVEHKSGSGKRSQQRREFNDTAADRCRSLERTPSRSSIGKGSRANTVISSSPRMSPARSRRGLSVSSSSQPKAANSRTTTRANAQATENGRRKSDQMKATPQPTSSASRIKQHSLLTRRSQTPRLSVVSTPKPESEQDGWNDGRTAPLKWQMSVFERLYYNRKR